MNDIETTEKDVVLDVIAALDMYAGSIGNDNVVIDAVDEGERETIVLTLSNGDRYELRVREVRP